MSFPAPHNPPDVFEQIFALLTPERVLRDPRATGEGIKLCLIDSGVEQATLVERFRQRGLEIQPIAGGIFTAERAEPLPYRGHQSTPHGTTVADIILTLAPRVRLYSADILGPQGTCEVDVVMRALHWAIDVWKCKIINLSLGVPEHRLQQVQRRYQFLRAIEEGYYKDVLIFAAAHNEHPLTHSYPAMFAPSLVSVDKNIFADPLEFAYNLREQIEFQAHGRGNLGPFANEPATSWAAPHLAGIAARILSLRPDLKPFELKTILYWLSKHFQR
ncbi:MAG TPA: S8 family serine peptidase [Gemmataceae bacterium]|nr:S8 family serine peptidase [Gemmataceae bacterium]